ncbi:hypothetical protein QC764_120640 [Podospora pseudoanserina]|uniref:Uncharacterized protein n=1 Tax=Podospora pseudoanserina TaxID=2609844 RepID=A0ABR0IST8_9PEZI|nr:hypothetical protein QC764_120640 [Podospora pseudoanserina]
MPPTHALYSCQWTLFTRSRASISQGGAKRNWKLVRGREHRCAETKQASPAPRLVPCALHLVPGALPCLAFWRKPSRAHNEEKSPAQALEYRIKIN